MDDPAHVHTFLFADLAGYTALTEAHGDEAAADAAAEFCDSVRSLLSEYEAEEVKAIGDALMVRVREAGAAARLAERIVCDYGARHRGLGIGVGMHTGTAVRRGDDWFGSAVNLASRVADVARAGEVLLTQPTRDELGDAAAVRRRGPRRFKNVAQPIMLFELRLSGRELVAALPIDPVCRMAVDSGLAERHAVYRGVEYHFCSDRCADAFAAHPGQYARRRSTRESALVSEDARERAADHLRRAYARGRLDHAELEERTQSIYESRTRGELQTATRDLPRRTRRPPIVVVVFRWATRPVRRRWRRRSARRQLR